MIAASGLMDQRDGHCGPREVVGGEYKQTLVEEINVHVLFCFSFRTIGQEEQGCLRERAYLHHFLSTQTLRNTFGHLGELPMASF